MASASSGDPMRQPQKISKTKKASEHRQDSSSPTPNSEGNATGTSPQPTAISTHIVPEDGSDDDEDNIRALQVASNKRGRPLKNWTKAQSDLLQTKTDTFLACAETQKDFLLGKTLKTSWPKPLRLCLEKIQEELVDKEEMRPLLNANLVYATTEHPLSKADEDQNKTHKQENMIKWKNNVRGFYRNKLRDWRGRHDEQLLLPKGDQAAYVKNRSKGKDHSSHRQGTRVINRERRTRDKENKGTMENKGTRENKGYYGNKGEADNDGWMDAKVFLANFGPRNLFAKENAAKIRKRRDELLAQKPELRSNNGASYQTALSELWADADQNAYVEKAKEQVSDLESDRTKLTEALYWFLNALSPRLGEVEMMLVYAYRNDGGGISVQSVEAPCKSRANLDARFDVEHEQSWESFLKGFLKWGDDHIPQRFIKAPEPNQAVVIPKNLEGVPVFPDGKFSDLTVTAMRDLLTAYFKAVCWPADSQMGAIPWGKVAEHPEDYYDQDQLPKDKKLQPPGSMKNSEIVTWVEYFEERPRIPPFVFFPRSQIEEHLHRREAEALADLNAGQEPEDESTPHPSSPAPELITDNLLNPKQPVPASTFDRDVEDPSSTVFDSFPSSDISRVIDPPASHIQAQLASSNPSQLASASAAEQHVQDQPSTSSEDDSPQVTMPSLKIKIPPLSKGPVNVAGVGDTVETSADVVEEKEGNVNGKKKKGRGGKGTGNKGKVVKGKERKALQGSDQTREGEEAVGEQKRKLDHVGETEEQGAQKRARTDANSQISATDVGSVVQPTQRRSGRLRNARNPPTGSA
ncbi:hypothetical protein K435DRAFT_867528 [Dendrothele bispora CBS 962.96]|uniref:Uncharacterized protein n=1 Tax=Dendrothele bispora (strain CBS 962.96) TaxID=1314807 RepID=A0A4V4HDJ5_DENBC|nr:hypothetical protein K435DRAFT_867528 [Dendrothele bispora CBS 962.96]